MASLRLRTECRRLHLMNSRPSMLILATRVEGPVSDRIKKSFTCFWGWFLGVLSRARARERVDGGCFAALATCLRAKFMKDGRPGGRGAWPPRLRCEWEVPVPRLNLGILNSRDDRSPTQPGRLCSILRSLDG